MGRRIDISWDPLDISVVAELADEVNPELCDDIWKNLPFTVLQSHPTVSGESVYAWAPMVSTAPVRHWEPINQAPAGRLRYSQATGNKLTVQYGKGLEPLSQPVVGTVQPEYLHLLPIMGRAVWESTFWTKQLIWLTVKRHGENPVRPASPPTLREPASAFVAEADRIQTTEPEDLRNLRMGLVKSAGSYGQYFSTWDFANGMLRDYVMYTIYPLLRLSDRLDVSHVAEALEALDPPYSTFLGYVGFGTLQKFADQLRPAVRGAASKEDLQMLLRAFLRYANRLCSWSYHYFPWYLGIFYQRQDYADGLPGRWPAQIRPGFRASGE
jgi:hypothetical protein